MLKDYHPEKYVKDRGLYLTGCLLHDWLGKGFVNHFCIKVSMADIASGGTLANFRAVRSHSCNTLSNDFW